VGPLIEQLMHHLAELADLVAQLCDFFAQGLDGAFEIGRRRRARLCRLLSLAAAFKFTGSAE
jgi:hypothetical protein